MKDVQFRKEMNKHTDRMNDKSKYQIYDEYKCEITGVKIAID
jgi:hypothetical protein